MRVRRSDPSEEGIRRVGRGKGFSYHLPDEEKIDDDEVLERIRDLAIPPAWSDVWICPDHNGHIQAVGTDDAGRRQYLYHQAWRDQRDREKFERLTEFARTLPAARKALAADLELRGLVRERVMACAVRLLDIGFFRVGGEVYAEENETFGLATLEKRHVRVRKGGIDFEYVAKGGVERSQEIADTVVLPTILALKRRRGPASDPLLAYREGRSTWRDVSSDEVNEWLKALLGDDYSAKDFRTWNATVIAAGRLAEHDDADDRSRAITATIEEVAKVLGNTPAVCRASYVDPRVIAAFESGRTIKATLKRLDPERSRDFASREAIERAVLRLLAKG